MIYNTILKGGSSGGGTALGLTAEEWGGTVVNGQLVQNAGKSPDYSAITTIAKDNFLAYAYYYRSDIIGPVSFTNLTTFSPGYTRMLYYTYAYSRVTSASFDSLITVDDNGISVGCAPFYHTFEGCTSLTSISFPNLTTINSSKSDYFFCSLCESCSNLTTASFPKLTSIVTYDSSFSDAFARSRLTSLEFPKLESYENTYKNYSCSPFYEFCYYCTSLTTVRFTKLKSITFDSTTSSSTSFMSRAFASCYALTDVYFNALDTLNNVPTQYFMNNMLQGCSNVTVHFKSGTQSLFSSYPAFTTGFGGSGTTILYDL